MSLESLRCRNHDWPADVSGTDLDIFWQKGLSLAAFLHPNGLFGCEGNSSAMKKLGFKCLTFWTGWPGWLRPYLSFNTEERKKAELREPEYAKVRIQRVDS